MQEGGSILLLTETIHPCTCISEVSANWLNVWIGQNGGTVFLFGHYKGGSTNCAWLHTHFPSPSYPISESISLRSEKSRMWTTVRPVLWVFRRPCALSPSVNGHRIAWLTFNMVKPLRMEQPTWQWPSSVNKNPQGKTICSRTVVNVPHYTPCMTEEQQTNKWICKSNLEINKCVWNYTVFR